MGKLAQSLAYGARTLLVRGDFDDCLKLVESAHRELGVYLLNSINPFRLEGQKTIVLELLQQAHTDRVTVWSSVNVSITWLPPTRPIPLSVPARPPNGRCASQ